MRLDVDWDQVRRLMGEVLRTHGMMPESDRVSAMLQQARAAGRADVLVQLEQVLSTAEVEAADRCEVNSGLWAWLETIPHSVPMAVLSLNSRRAVERALQRCGLAWRVTGWLGREDVSRPKPDPEGLLRLLADFGAAPAQTLFVGDSESDFTCGRAAGVQTLAVGHIGVSWVRPPLK